MPAAEVVVVKKKISRGDAELIALKKISRGAAELVVMKKKISRGVLPQFLIVADSN